MRITYAAASDKNKIGSPYWQVLYRDPKDEFKLKSIDDRHYTKWNAHHLAEMLNSAVQETLELNGSPTIREKLLNVNYLDQDDANEAQRALDILSEWLNTTDRLLEVIKGGLVERIRSLSAYIVNRLHAADNVTLKNDGGRWMAYYK